MTDPMISDFLCKVKTSGYAKMPEVLLFCKILPFKRTKPLGLSVAIK